MNAAMEISSRIRNFLFTPRLPLGIIQTTFTNICLLLAGDNPPGGFLTGSSGLDFDSPSFKLPKGKEMVAK